MTDAPTAPAPLAFHPLPGLPEISPGDDLAGLIAAGLERAALVPAAGDVLLIAQKAVSRAAGLIVSLDDITPSPRARTLAAKTGKHAAFVELVLQESRSVVACRPGVLITEHVSGAIMANAGIDRSNAPGGSADAVCLLPRDPDASAEALRDGLADIAAARGWASPPAVIITDSWGRPFRLGAVGFALGVAGMAARHDLRGAEDLYGRPLETSDAAVADALAAAADLVMGQANEGRPAVLARGFTPSAGDGGARDLLRPQAEDLFR